MLGILLLIGIELAVNRPGPPEPDANGLVVLLTDYGSADPYVGILKGVILSANPRARIVDASHDAAAYDIAGASYFLGQVAPEYPAGTTFVVVIDPGVGTARRRIAARTWPARHTFVAPDNGVLTDVLAKAPRVEVRELANPAWRRPGPESTTFHGRDWFGPVGGHLAAGEPFEQVGPVVDRAVALRRTPPDRRADGSVAGSVVYVDHYGNVLTNVPASLLSEAGLSPGDRLLLTLGGRPAVAAPWVSTYADVAVGQLLVSASTGARTLEVAVNQGNAGERLGVSPGDQVVVRRAGR